MYKEEFITAIKPELKKRGYRKNGLYWYKYCDGFICCFNIQASNWDSRDYYVNIGLTLSDSKLNKPTQLKWYCRHRCKGESGDRNILPEEVLAYLDETFGKIKSKSEIRQFLINQHAVEMPGQSQLWY